MKTQAYTNYMISLKLCTVYSYTDQRVNDNYEL